MSVIANLSVGVEDFALGQTLVANPGTTVRLERVVPIGDGIIPYLWVSNDDVGAVLAALEADEDVESFEVLDAVESEALVRIDWSAALVDFVDGLVATNAVLLEATGQDGGWHVQLRFPDSETLAEFYRHCADGDVGLTIESVHDPAVLADLGPQFELTDTQRETLRRALEAGYFGVPRRTNLVQLAEELGISDTAVSQRLRRGIATLVAATLSPGEDEG